VSESIVVPVVGGGVPSRRGWVLSLYREAAEAGACWRVPEVDGRGRAQPDPVRAAAEASRRARGMIRRYCAANRLNRLGTLTYAGEGCHDPAAVSRAMRAIVSIYRSRPFMLGQD
jgi:hypothetical protein